MDVKFLLKDDLFAASHAILKDHIIYSHSSNFLYFGRIHATDNNKRSYKSTYTNSFYIFFLIDCCLRIFRIAHIMILLPNLGSGWFLIKLSKEMYIKNLSCFSNAHFF